MCCTSDNHNYMCHTCAKEFLKFKLQLSSYWQNIKFSPYCPKFHIFTNIVKLLGCLYFLAPFIHLHWNWFFVMRWNHYPTNLCIKIQLPLPAPSQCCTQQWSVCQYYVGAEKITPGWTTLLVLIVVVEKLAANGPMIQWWSGDGYFTVHTIKF